MLMYARVSAEATTWINFAHDVRVLQALLIYCAWKEHDLMIYTALKLRILVADRFLL